MPIVCKTSIAQLNSMLNKRIESVKDDAVYRLHMIGTAAVKRARELTPDGGSFHDRTGNLRSSIGYIILDDGEVCEMSDFSAVSGPKGNGSEGTSAGRKLLNELKSNYNKGIVLIVCAGMNYATYVESRGKDVLTSAELEAESLAQTLLKKFKI